jgi:hypothetical protein
MGLDLQFEQLTNYQRSEFDLLNLEHFPHLTHDGLPWVNFLPQSLQKVTPGFSGSRRFILIR